MIMMVNISSRDAEFVVDIENVTEENGPKICPLLDSGSVFDDHENKELVKEKSKKKSKTSKKHPKPPLPPKGPSLCAADEKFIREISEIAMLKRARTERVKALKKIKAARTNSSNGNLLAMAFTILFCTIILFQGIRSRSSGPVGFQGSPESAAASTGSLISVQYFRNISSNESNSLDSASPGSVEQVSGLDPHGKDGASSIIENFSESGLAIPQSPFSCVEDVWVQRAK